MNTSAIPQRGSVSSQTGNHNLDSVFDPAMHRPGDSLWEPIQGRAWSNTSFNPNVVDVHDRRWWRCGTTRRCCALKIDLKPKRLDSGLVPACRRKRNYVFVPSSVVPVGSLAGNVVTEVRRVNEELREIDVIHAACRVNLRPSVQFGFACPIECRWGGVLEHADLARP